MYVWTQSCTDVDEELECLRCSRLLLEEVEAALKSVADVRHRLVCVDEEQAQSENKNNKL